jgi:2,5-diamino-6-(ribosylamino)-4(3H)-pyrimidinone 5'-phosphate reductase
MRPFTFINIAASADGKISDESRRQLRISCGEDLLRVDELRASSDAIMVGIGTVLSDNPSLTIKSETLRLARIRKSKSENPVRVVVDSKCKIPLNSRVFEGNAETIIATTTSADKEKVRLLKERAEVVFSGDEKVNLKNLLEVLYKKGIEKVMVEGGGTLINSMLREGLIDEMTIYYGNMLIGGKDSPTIVDGWSFDEPIKLELVELTRLGSGILTRWKVIRK